MFFGVNKRHRAGFSYTSLPTARAKEISTMIGRNYSQSALLRSQIDTLELNLKEIAVIRWRLAAQKRALEQAEAQLVPREAAE